MKTAFFFISLLISWAIFSCKKDTTGQQVITIPNGDFELWDNTPSLLYWQTNSCPACVPPFETYIVQKVTDSYNGLFAAKLIYNNVYNSFAYNKFSIPSHPALLTGYVKSNIANSDTVRIHIDIFSGNNIVDTGNWYETASTTNYRIIEIPISQNTSSVDSALITIVGGKKQNTEFYVDNFALIKTTK